MPRGLAHNNIPCPRRSAVGIPTPYRDWAVGDLLERANRYELIRISRDEGGQLW